MKLFEYMQNHHHEQVAFWNDAESGLRAIIAIHDTTLGPALGGVRMWPYPSEDKALLDVLRLSEAMSYKASIAGLDLGGGKAVIIGDPTQDKSERLFRSFGRFINSLNGRYVTAEDVGTTVSDINYVRQETTYVSGLPTEKGGSGDPSILTAFGVYQGIKASCKSVFGSDSLTNRRVAVQGVGKVGRTLVGHLCSDGARVIVGEINPNLATYVKEEFDVELVAPDKIYTVKADVFAPCALGAGLNDETIPQLQCAIVAGAANNQLAEEVHGEMLHQRDILYVPDYVINSGGIISVVIDLGAYDAAEAKRRAGDIYHTVLRVIDISQKENIPTNVAALQLAKARIEKEKQHQKEAVLAIA